MTISSMPASSILKTRSSSSSVFAATMTSPVSGSTTSSSVDAAEDAVAEGLDDFAGVLELRHADAVERSAVELGDDGVLRDVDETTREVTGVRRLERGVREALTSAVRRDEVLENGETLAEVRLDRVLDDLARGLGHETAHSGELTNLLRASRARQSPP